MDRVSGDNLHEERLRAGAVVLLFLMGVAIVAIAVIGGLAVVIRAETGMSESSALVSVVLLFGGMVVLTYVTGYLVVDVPEKVERWKQ